MEALSDDEVERGMAKWAEFNTVYTNEKAGMAGADKKKIQKAIYELSKVNSVSNFHTQYFKLHI